MANKNFRVVARRTTYFYLDVVAKNKEAAMEEAWLTPENEFIQRPDPQNEWKVIDVILMDKKDTDEIDDLRYLNKQ